MAFPFHQLDAQLANSFTNRLVRHIETALSEGVMLVQEKGRSGVGGPHEGAGGTLGGVGDLPKRYRGCTVRHSSHSMRTM